VLFTAVIDANALYPSSLRDILLRLAEAELFVPLWSERIVEEMRRNLVPMRKIGTFLRLQSLPIPRLS
jgi:hypothetical protein